LFSVLHNQAIIRLASKDGEPIGALLTIFYKNVLVYKYSCGEPGHFKHGGMQFLLWRAIEDAKGRDIEELDFGRSDFQDQGLMVYKERWGAVRTQTGYFQTRALHRTRSHWLGNVRNKINFARFVPQGILATTGRLLYRHFG
jgi:lipid II:glycine glycyltransferase (peptidoglycan interpeptide bridge formation enzyme)